MHNFLKIALLGFIYTTTAFDLEDYATTYRATRDAYLKAANELKLATGPYKAARDAYVAATATYTKSLYERRRLGMVEKMTAKNMLRKAAGLKTVDPTIGNTDSAIGMSYGTHGTPQTKADTPPGALVTGGTYRTAGQVGNGQDGQYAHIGGIDSFWVPERLCYEQIDHRAFLRSIKSTQLIN